MKEEQERVATLLIALVIGVFLAGEAIHPLGYLTMAFILLGVALLQYGSRTLLSKR